MTSLTALHLISALTSRDELLNIDFPSTSKIIKDMKITPRGLLVRERIQIYGPQPN